MGSLPTIRPTLARQFLPRTQLGKWLSQYEKPTLVTKDKRRKGYNADLREGLPMGRNEATQYDQCIQVHRLQQLLQDAGRRGEDWRLTRTEKVQGNVMLFSPSHLSSNST